MSNTEINSNVRNPKRSSKPRALRISVLDFENCFEFRISDFGFGAERAFTIIELLVVIALIIVLAGLVLSTIGYVQNKGSRSRAETEIAAMSAALENYKSDNGIYPRDPTANTATDKLDARTMVDAASANTASYKSADLVLYRAISGDRDQDRKVTATDESTNIDGQSLSPALTELPKTYFGFKPNQLSPTDQTVNVQYVRDPFGNPYGYSTAYQYDVDQKVTPSHGYNPTFDLWSTANSTDPNQWIKNW